MAGKKVSIDIIRKKIDQLVKKLNNYNYYYYEKDSPIVTDEVYDKLFKELKNLELEYPQFIQKNSPTQVVSGKVAEKFSKVKHSFSMLSLANGFNEEDIYNFIKRLQRFLNVDKDFFPTFIAEPKIDGLSLSLRYEKGKLIQALTRGDGVYGEDVTLNALTIKNIPHSIDTKIEILEVRGEVYITKEDFLKLNDEQEALGKKPFANPRNAASGSLRHIDSQNTANRPLKFMAWGYGEISEYIGENLSEIFDYFAKIKININPLNRICKNLNDIFSYYNEISEKRHSIAYDIDGLVFKVDDLLLQNRLGIVGKDPRWAIAYKFAAREAITKLNKIFISVGRTGALTPIALLEPVNIGGVIVTKASLHNEDEVSRKDIREGDAVIVKRAGDVIPQVVKVIKKNRPKYSKPFIMPDYCPVCGSIAIKENDKAVKRCTGRFSCTAMLVQSLVHFVSKNAFDIIGLGEQQIKLFYELGFIKTPYDIFFLSNYKDEIISLNGFGKKSFDKLITSINRSKNIVLDKFIYSLGIPTVGSKTAQIIAKKYITIDNFISSIQNPDKNKAYKELEDIDSIGSVTAEEVIMFFSNNVNNNVVHSLLDILDIQDYKIPELNEKNPLYGKIIVFTGTLEQFSRSEAKYIAEKLGAIVSSGLSSKTDYLVVGDNPGSKLTQAKQLGTTIIYEDRFINLTKGN